MRPITYTLKLPVAADDLGKWLEENGASIEISCMLGTYHVTVGKKVLISYSDDAGQHCEIWEVSRHHRNMMEALEQALRAAGAITEEPTS